MASSIANNEQDWTENGKVNDLDKFLVERQKPNPARDKIVHKSQEKFSVNRKHSADANSMSRIEKEEKLNDFLKHKRRRRKKKLTISDVNAEAANILEEFLQAQLLQQAIQTSSPEYQRIVEVDVTETTTPSGDTSSCFASSSNILREDSIPFADESDHEIRKTESLPHDVFTELPGEVGCKGLPVHHEKSKSAPYPQDNENGWMHGSRKKFPGSINPPPPPPPGTPHTPSEQGYNGSHSQLRPVPYTGEPTGSIESHSESLDNLISLERRHSPSKKRSPPRAPDTLTLPASIPSHSHSSTPLSDIDHGTASAKPKDFSQSPKKHSRMKLKHSGPISSSDTDDTNSHNTQGRKKKSMFKKAQERLQILLRVKKMRSADHEHMEYEDGYEGSLDEKRPKHKKKRGKSNKDMSHVLDLADNCEPEYQGKVLEDRYVHTNKHIYQTHTRGDDLNVVRSEDSTEHVVILNDRGEKHIDKRWKVKESSNRDGGLFRKLRRLTSREKNKKEIKGSKSAQFQKDASPADKSKYPRAISVPARDEQTGIDGHLKLYDNQRGFTFSNVGSEDLGHNTRRITGTQVIYGVESQDGDLRWNTSHLDIVNHSGQMIERLCFDADGSEIPTNMSFSYEQDGYVHEQRVDHHGRITIIKDSRNTGHMEVVEDSDDDMEMEEKSEHSNMTEADREELYGRIATRLANIGDNLMTEKEQSRSESTSPSSKLTHEQNSSPEQEFTKTKLTPLEVELRDELRKVADDMDAMLEANMKRAALHISGLVTYNHFKNIVQDSVDNKVGWAQVAAVFHITKRAMRLAGDSGALAMHIKEMSLKYIADRFAGWIVGQGGWDSMLSEDESETDSELD